MLIILLEFDALSVINLLNEQAFHLSKLTTITNVVKHIVLYWGPISLSFERRGYNQIAHHLAHSSCVNIIVCLYLEIVTFLFGYFI